RHAWAGIHARHLWTVCGDGDPPHGRATIPLSQLETRDPLVPRTHQGGGADMTQLTTALATVQAGLYSRLTGDATLMSMLAGQGVFDEVPENQPFNYITIANNFELRNDTFGR